MEVGELDVRAFPITNPRHVQVIKNDPPDGSPADLEKLRHVLERLISLGLVSDRPTAGPSRSPSLLTPLLPTLLAHLHPHCSSPFPAYPSSYFPSLILPLPSSTLASFVNSLLDHLTLRLTSSNADILSPDQPEERIKRAAVVLELILGPAKSGGEAMEAVVRCTTGTKRIGSSSEDHEHSRARLIVSWIHLSEENGKICSRASRLQLIRSAAIVLIDAVMETWTNAKNIRFSLFAEQFGLSSPIYSGPRR